MIFLPRLAYWPPGTSEGLELLLGTAFVLQRWRKLKFRAPTCGSGRAGLCPIICYHTGHLAYGKWGELGACRPFPSSDCSHQILKEKLHSWKGTEIVYIPVAIYSATPCFFFFLLISHRQDICQFSYMQRHSRYFSNQLNVTEKKNKLWFYFKIYEILF